jgi:hypothetical protein
LLIRRLAPTAARKEILVKKSTHSIILASLCVCCAWGCGASVPVPTQRMADAESAVRSARELGAASKSSAQLNLKLADEQIVQAKASVRDGENERADLQLIRAQADAELSLALAREEDARTAAQSATNASNAAASANANAKGVY